MSQNTSFEVYRQRGDSSLQGRGRLIAAGLLFLLAFILISSAATVVEVGTVGVVKRLGRVTGAVLDPGLHFIVPFTDSVIVYNTKDIVYETAPLEKQAGSRADYIDFPVDSTTNDGQQVLISFSVRFHILRDETTRIANQLGDEAAAVEKVVKFHSRVIARQVPRNYRASDLYTGDVAMVQQDIEDELRPLFQAQGLFLDAFGIREIAFSEEYVRAVEEKQIEQERVITEQNRARQAEFRKQAVITEAEGEAEAIRLRAAALAENPNIVQLEFVNAIRDPDSSVRLIVVPSDAVLPILNLGLQDEVASALSPSPSTGDSTVR
ncbi:MAG: prohibitin family protein [Anaerolineae bacterium]|nr:prohibitin family protein [Anaerolineae bacterium]